MGKKNSNKSKQLKKGIGKEKSPSKKAKSGKSDTIKTYQAAHEKCMKKNDTLKAELRGAKKKIRQLEKAILKINNKITRSKLKTTVKKGKGREKTEEVETAVKKKALKATPIKKVTSVVQATSDSITPPVDNLRLIEGIGPAIERHLKSVGINSFAVLGKTPARKIKAILLERGGSRYSVHDPSSWPRQAKLALAGKMDELKALQNELKARKQ